MVQSSQPATAQRVQPLAEESSFTVESVPSRADEVVSRALARSSLETTSSGAGTAAAGAEHLHLRASEHADSARFLSFPPSRVLARPTNTLHPVQEWEGHVVDIGDDEFVARLVDLSAGSSVESEEAIIPLAAIDEQDASRMDVGKIFRWVIGYERSVEGTRTHVSRIVFRDLPRMTARDFEEGQEWARSVLSAFDR